MDNFKYKWNQNLRSWESPNTREDHETNIRNMLPSLIEGFKEFSETFSPMAELEGPISLSFRLF